ncbi:hypothetical protein, partial [Kocuria salsicia]
PRGHQAINQKQKIWYQQTRHTIELTNNTPQRPGLLSTSCFRLVAIRKLTVQLCRSQLRVNTR